LKITVRVQVDAGTAEGQGAERFSEVFVLEREALTDASVGLSLTEAHTLLGSIQESVVSASSPTEARTSGTCRSTSIPTPSTTWTGSTSPCASL
jgi:hypothetical protein